MRECLSCFGPERIFGKSIVGLMAAAGLQLAFAGPVEWEFPIDRSCHQGLAFADGRTGVLVWGGGDTLNLTVGRADLWDHRGGYSWLDGQSYTNIVALVQAGKKDDLLALFRKETPEGQPRNPYMLPLGRVVVKLQGATLARGELDPFTGLGRLFLADGRTIGLAMSKTSRTFALRLGQDLACTVGTRHCMEFPRARGALAPLGFRPADMRDDAQRGTGGFFWELPADEPVSLAWSRRGQDLLLATARGKTAARPEGTFGKVRDASVAEWRDFWAESARVEVPDETVQRVFDYGMYRFGAMTDPDGVPAGLQGAWLEDDRLVPWNGDYHFNINVQECYSPAFRGGHLKNLLPLFRMVKGWVPRLRENAKKFCGIDDGLVLPHSVDDRGVCIGGFWTGTIDHASTAWVAAMMFRYVKYSRDLAFLKSDAYPFMKGAMNVYRAMMEERGGKLSIPLGPSPEWCGADVQKAVGRDPSFQLAAAHRLCRDLVAAAGLLGEAPDPMWLDVERRLPPYVADGSGILLFQGQQLTESHRHHSHMAGLYPFDTVDLSDTRTKGVVVNTYRRWVRKGTGAWTGWCVPWASILHTHVGNAPAAAELIRCWDTFFCNDGHGSHHNAYRQGFSDMMMISYGPRGEIIDGGQVMQMDGQCAAVTAVLEMMVHEVNGKVEYFRGCPASWKRVSFENVLGSDGRRVSGVRENGKVTVR